MLRWYGASSRVRLVVARHRFAVTNVLPMKLKEGITPALVSIIVGVIVLKWEWAAYVPGLDIHVSRTQTTDIIKYVVGLVAALSLGYAFPRQAIVCGVCLMLGPTLIAHSIYIFQKGVPNLWPLELLFIAALTIPYIVFAYGAAYLRRRWSKSQAAPETQWSK